MLLLLKLYYSLIQLCPGFCYPNSCSDLGSWNSPVYCFYVGCGEWRVMWNVTSVICYPDINNLLHNFTQIQQSVSVNSMDPRYQGNSIIAPLSFKLCSIIVIELRVSFLKSSKKDFKWSEIDCDCYNFPNSHRNEMYFYEQ